MKIINFPNKSEFSNLPKVFALGKFESIHLGHRNLLKRARIIADEENSELVIMIFSQRLKNNLYSLEERLMFLKEYNPDYILIFEPSEGNFNWTHTEFEEYLENLNASKIVIGSDFQYGNGRKGTSITLASKFKVEVIEKPNDQSTSSIVESVINKDFKLFKELMGHYFFYKGKVVKGEGNGRKFGMPTANVEYPEYKIDAGEGIYYSYVIYDGKRMPSLTSISNNPTLEAKQVTYETYIYNFDEDIYGKEIYVELIEKYRDPIKFESIEKLIEQLEEDKALGKKYFNL